jgi:hypothetical protein
MCAEQLVLSMQEKAKADTAPAHSRLSPSHAYQWTECTASVAYKESNAHLLPRDTSSSASIEGTKAHAVCESMVREEPLPAYATPDMRHHGRAYAEYVKAQRGPNPVAWGIEHRVRLYYYLAQKGTVDFFAHNSEGVFVTDYKYGFGEVASSENRQMAAYARSILRENILEWDIQPETPVVMTIFQPRITSTPTPWVIPYRDLVQFTEDTITPAAKLILAEPAWPAGWDKATPPPGSSLKFSPSPATCKFCPAAAICKAKQESHLKLLPEIEDLLFAASDIPPTVLTQERMVWIVNNRHILEDWLDDMQKHIDGLVTSGIKIPGRKVVLSKGGHRKWTDPVAAGNLLVALGVPRDEVYSEEIASPAQAEKLFTDRKSENALALFKLITKPPGSPIVVPENDPRPEHAVSEADVGELIPLPL